MAKNGGRAMNPREYSKDVNINYFANSCNPKTGRVKKNEIDTVISQVRHLSTAENIKSWNEKVKYLDKKNVKRSKPKRNFPNGCKEKKSNKKKNYTFINKRRNYYHLPISVWDKVSEFISPEDVGRFACICKDTWAVVSTASFWFRLYKRYYREVADLPEELQPRSLDRKYGLRANVIRALHFMYPPFVNKFKSQRVEEGPHSLVKRSCVSSWSEKKEKHWFYYFKLNKCQNVKYGRKSHDDESKPGLLEKLEDINANADVDCKLLEVKALDYIPLPMIYGQILIGASLSLSNDYSCRRLELRFGCDSYDATNNYIKFNSVRNVRVLDWWHPSFPYSNRPSIDLSSCESNYLIDEIDFST